MLEKKMNILKDKGKVLMTLAWIKEYCSIRIKILDMPSSPLSKETKFLSNISWLFNILGLNSVKNRIEKFVLKS